MNAAAPAPATRIEEASFLCKHRLCGGASGYGRIALNGYMSAVWCEWCLARHHLLVGQLPDQPMLIVAGGLWPESNAVGPSYAEHRHAAATEAASRP